MAYLLKAIVHILLSSNHCLNSHVDQPALCVFSLSNFSLHFTFAVLCVVSFFTLNPALHP